MMSHNGYIRNDFFNFDVMKTGSKLVSLGGCADLLVAMSRASRARAAHRWGLYKFLQKHPHLINKDFTL
jgi:hypothetical protein